MKNKKKKIILISVITLLIITGVIVFVLLFNGDEKKSEKEEENNDIASTPLLYEVTKEGTDNKIYLFGSIHVSDDRAYPLPDAVLSAYSESDYLAVEFDLIAYSNDMEKQISTLQTLLCENGQTVKDLLKSDTYDMMVSYLKENNVYNSMYDYYKPALFYSLVSNVQTDKSGLDSDKGIDMYFLKKAKEDGKEILEVESADYQYNMLASFPNELFDFMIKYSIDYESILVLYTKNLYELWLTGDAESLSKFIKSDSETEYDYEGYENLEEIMNNYNETLIDQRNVEMANKAEEYFNNGKDVFFVVGAAHIVGDDALVDLLTERGYSVKEVNY